MKITSKTTPRSYQLQALELTKDAPYYAIFMDQGTGKTKLSLDTAAYLYNTGKIDGVVVICPNNVKTTWALDEIPRHLDGKITTITYSPPKRAANCIPDDSLTFLIMNYEATITEQGKICLMRFLESRRCLFILDESTRIKTPGAKRTRALLALGKRAPYKRILTGTPVKNSPFNAYSQIKFLDNDFWKNKGITNFNSFKHRFADVEIVKTQTGKYYPKILGYKNLSVLKNMLDSISFRVLKKDVEDLPEKVYTKRYFELTPSQFKVYSSVRSSILLELSQSDTLTMTQVITKLIRLQQITSGFLVSDEGTEISLDNARLDCLMDILEDVPETEQVVIFAKFRYDIQAIAERLGREKCSLFDGSVPTPVRELGRRKFLAGDTRFFVANFATASMGLTLTNAATMIFYNSTWDAEQRVQAEDRCHRIGQINRVLYVDLIARGTIDEKIIETIDAKDAISTLIIKDELKGWL